MRVGSIEYNGGFLIITTKFGIICIKSEQNLAEIFLSALIHNRLFKCNLQAKTNLA